MTRFAEIVKQDTPRLVVMYRNEGGKDQFTWGIIGQVPITSLIGHIVRVETDIVNQHAGWFNECDQLALVIMWDANLNEFAWFTHRDIPVDPLIGMLETVKACLVDMQMANMMQQKQSGLIAPDGRPIPKHVLRG